ncbi:MAG: DMT family transporter, partial [Azonexus sp.]|jgi:drug/metabolite transporter (DMT)-like permease|nr:DMT family transporter [Azonexus sp.]
VLQYIGPFDFNALRCIFGALVLMVMLPLTGRSLQPPPWKPVLWIGVLQTAGLSGLAQLALVSGGAGKTAVLVYTMPFWAILMTALLFKEKPRLSEYVAMLIAALGLVLVLQPWQWRGTPYSSLIAIGAGAAWAGGTLVAKRAFRHQSTDILSLLAWQTVVGAIALSALALTTHEKEIVWSSYLLLAIAYNAVVVTAVAWAMWLFVLRVLPVSVAGLSSLITPVMSVLWAWWLLGERPSLAEGGGITLIMLALASLGSFGALQAALRRFFTLR